jgi:hypothetical protein
MFTVKKASREAAPLTIALIGGTGSGKTLSALNLAAGLTGDASKVTIIDTESRRSSIYADHPHIEGFNQIDFTPPYSSCRFQEAVQTAIEQGAKAVIIDSASHEHEAEGGILDYADQERIRLTDKAEDTARRYNKPFNRDNYDPGFQIWVKPKTQHNRYVRYAVGCPAHVIFCIREKEVNEMQRDHQGKRHIVESRKPACDPKLLYEMTLVMRLSNNEGTINKATYIKVPEPFKKLVRNNEIITVTHGEKLVTESSKGAPPQYAGDLQKLISVCEDVASLGTERLRQHWESLDGAAKAALEPHKSRLKEIASEAEVKIQECTESETDN